MLNKKKKISKQCESKLPTVRLKKSKSKPTSQKNNSGSFNQNTVVAQSHSSPNVHTDFFDKSNDSNQNDAEGSDFIFDSDN